jgi:ABC-type phosphate transport system permease subunit
VLVISVICVPYPTKATETSLNQVPSTYRDGAEAPGLPVASPGKVQQYLAYDAALLLSVLVPIVIIPGRAIVATCRRQAK